MTSTKRQLKYAPELRARAFRKVAGHRSSYPTLWATVEAIAPKIGCGPSRLYEWVKRAEIHSGTRPGLTSEKRDRPKALEMEDRELRQANQILRKASAYSAHAELDRPNTS